MNDADRPVPTPAEVAGRVAEIEARIAAACAAAGRSVDADPVTLIGVTKTFPLAYAESAVAAGLVDLGENYAVDLADKADAAAEIGLDARWHFIGGLQRNKVKRLAGRVWLWHTVDRAALVDEVAKRDPGARILVQVNTTDEAQKSGCAPSDAAALIDRAGEAGLRPLGLMTIGPTGPGGTAADPRPAFALLRELGDTCGVAELSMGMSADYELAVAEGATMVRIGSAIFGPRTRPT